MTVQRDVEWAADSALEPVDCETCGISYEGVTVGWDGETFSVSASWGCYSGDSAYDLTLDGLRGFLAGLPEGLMSNGDRDQIMTGAEKEWLMREAG